MKYTTVIYDLDGTLLDTLDDMTACVNHALAQGGYPVHTSAEVRRFVGNGMLHMIRMALPEGTPEADVLKTLEHCKAYYRLHTSDLSHPYPGVMNTLRRLSEAGVQQIILSNKVHSFVEELHRIFFEGVIDRAVGEQAGIPRKPAPDGLLKVMKEMHIDPSQVLYVGDSDVDVITARNAGVDCLAVCWGFRSIEELKAAGATRFAASADEIAALVLA